MDFKKGELQSKDFLSLANHSTDEIKKLLENAKILKEKTMKGLNEAPLAGKTLAMIFEKPSTRTRVSFETGIYQLGGQGIFLNSNDMQLGRGETIADTAKVLSQYVDGIMIRTFSHEIVEELAVNATIPIINGLTDKYHPCQALADMLTITEQKGSLEGLRFVYVGDGNNVAHSLMIACAKLSIDCVVAVPEGYEPDEDVIKLANEIATENNCISEISNDPYEAVTNADIIYTDVWVSMGDEESAEKLTKFKDFQVNERLVAKAKQDYIFMHCLPAERGVEVSADVIDGDNSVVFQQAGNRLHAQKAIMVELMSN